MGIRPLYAVLIIAAATVLSVLGSKYWDSGVAYIRGLKARSIPPRHQTA